MVDCDVWSVGGVSSLTFHFVRILGCDVSRKKKTGCRRWNVIKEDLVAEERSSRRFGWWAPFLGPTWVRKRSVVCILLIIVLELFTGHRLIALDHNLKQSLSVTLTTSKLLTLGFWFERSSLVGRGRLKKNCWRRKNVIRKNVWCWRVPLKSRAYFQVDRLLFNS